MAVEIFGLKVYLSDLNAPIVRRAAGLATQLL